MAIISSGHELSLLRAGEREEEREGERGEEGRRRGEEKKGGEEGRRRGEEKRGGEEGEDEEGSIIYCCQQACGDLMMTHSPQAASDHQ